MSNHTSDFAQDILVGAAAIAEFVFNDRAKRRAIYYLVGRTRFPSFKLGATICARRSEILKWVAAQELRFPVPRGPMPQT